MGHLQLGSVSILLLLKLGSLSDRTRMHALFYHLPCPTLPPPFPIPDVSAVDGMHSKVSSQQSYAAKSPMPCGKHMFQAMCGLAVIVHEVVCQYYDAERGPSYGRVTSASAESIYQKLLAWSDILPECLKRPEACQDPPLMLFQ